MSAILIFKMAAITVETRSCIKKIHLGLYDVSVKKIWKFINKYWFYPTKSVHFQLFLVPYLFIYVYICYCGSCHKITDQYQKIYSFFVDKYVTVAHVTKYTHFLSTKNVITFEPFDRFSKILVHCNPKRLLFPFKPSNSTFQVLPFFTWNP